MMRICPECREEVIEGDTEMCSACRWDQVEASDRRLHRLFFALWIIVIFGAMVLFSGCAAMDGYDRSHSFSYQDAEGRSLNYAIQLRPTKGYEK